MIQHIQPNRHTRLPRRALQLLFAVTLGANLMLMAMYAPIARAATITVTTTDDEVNSDGDCSLREAVRAANLDQAVDACPAGNGADTIRLPAGTYILTVAGMSEDAALTGDLDITEDLTINGARRTNTTIDAGGLDRVFDLIGAPVVQIVDVTITGGRTGSDSAAAIDVGVGTLTLTRSRVTDNVGNGVIQVITGALTLDDSRVDNNVGTNGGGILIGNLATATLIDSVVDSNSASFDGGAIVTAGTLTVVNSTISGNSAAGDGGGIFASSGTTNLYNVTISNNTADAFSTNNGDGGGVSGTGTVNIRNSIIAGNFDGTSAGTQHPDCSGTLTSQGYNLIQSTIGCTINGSPRGNITGVNPDLGPLQGNGGNTLTHALQTGSPAIDAGNPSGCADQNSVDLTTDQRGYARIGICDMGAYEYDSPGPPTPTITPTATHTPINEGTATHTPTGTPTHTATPGPSPTPGGLPEFTPTATAGSTSNRYGLYLALIQK